MPPSHGMQRFFFSGSAGLMGRTGSDEPDGPHVDQQASSRMWFPRSTTTNLNPSAAHRASMMPTTKHSIPTMKYHDPLRHSRGVGGHRARHNPAGLNPPSCSQTQRPERSGSSNARSEPSSGRLNIGSTIPKHLNTYIDTSKSGAAGYLLLHRSFHYRITRNPLRIADPPGRSGCQHPRELRKTSERSWLQDHAPDHENSHTGNATAPANASTAHLSEWTCRLV